MLLGGAGLAIAATAVAQDESAANPPVMENIVVVGSALGVNAQEAESRAIPVQLLSDEDIALSGQFTIGELMRTQPAFAGSLGAIEGDGTGRQTLNLRGLGDIYTLTLLNGRRFAVNGPANVAAIPVAAIERIELLKAGASGLYGSDAVAGVVNVTLKDSFEGVGADVTYGAASDGYDVQDYSLYFGHGGERGRFFALANHYSSASIDAVDRRVTASNDNRPLGGSDGRSDANNPAPIIFGNFEQVLVLDQSRVGRGEASLDPADYRSYDFDADRYDRRPDGMYALAPTDRYSFVFNGAYEVGANTTVTGNALFNRTSTESVSGTPTIFADVPASNPHNPFGEDVAVFFRPFPPGFRDIGAITERDIDTVTAAIGLQHRLTDKLMVDVSANLFREDESVERPNAYLDSAFRAGLASSGADALNPFCNRCNPLERYEGILVGAQSELETTLVEFDARVTGEPFELPTGTVEAALGLYWREEDFELRPDRLLADGLLTDEGTAAAQELSRDVAAVFAEARIPLLAQRAGSGSSPLELGLAARYEDFSDFGGTFNPLISLRSAIIPDEVVLRASYNTAFRAPSLESLTAAQEPSEVTVFDPAVNDFVEVIALSGGNPDLDAETAETLSVGVIWTPEFLQGAFFSLDLWQVDQEDLVVSPDPQAVILGDIPGNVIRGDNIGQGGEDVIIEAFLTNVTEREMRGVDLSIDYQAVLGTVDVGFDLAATYLHSFKTDLLDGRGLVDEAGTASLGFGGLPDYKAIGGVTAGLGDFTGRIQISHTSSYEDSFVGGAFSEPRNIDSITYTDLSVRWAPALWDGRRLRVTLGVENVFDEMPPFVRANNYFDPGQHDIRGRYAYLSAGMDF